MIYYNHFLIIQQERLCLAPNLLAAIPITTTFRPTFGPLINLLTEKALIAFSFLAFVLLVKLTLLQQPKITLMYHMV
jgi:hypothetical protein